MIYYIKLCKLLTYLNEHSIKIKILIIYLYKYIHHSYVIKLNINHDNSFIYFYK